MEGFITFLFGTLLSLSGALGAGDASSAQAVAVVPSESPEIGFTEIQPNAAERGIATPASGSTGSNCTFTISPDRIAEGGSANATVNSTLAAGENWLSGNLYRCPKDVTDFGVCTRSTADLVSSMGANDTISAQTESLTGGLHRFFFTGYVRESYSGHSHTQIYQCFDDLVVVPPPDVDLTSSPKAIAYNTGATLQWSVSGDVSSCQAVAGPWGGPKSILGGSEPTGPLIIDTTYRLDCTGFGGTGSDQHMVDVIQPPTADLQVCRWDGSTETDCVANGASLLIAEGDAIRLSWHGGDEATTTCAAISGRYFDTDGDRIGSQVISNLTTDDHPQIYEVECSNISGVANDFVEVEIGEKCEPLAGLDAVDIVRSGGDFSLLWQKPVDIATCTISGGSLEIEAGDEEPFPKLCSTQTEFPVSISNRTEFTMSCNYPPDVPTVEVDVIPKIEEI